MKKYIQNIFFAILAGIFIYSCGATGDGMASDGESYDEDIAPAPSDTVRIANDSLEYEIIIIDPGFSSFLHSVAKPEGYYSQSYLENKNRFLVTDYNQRVQQPFRYDSDIYEQKINYDPQINYGYEVNYKLYNYFVYLSRRYNQDFSVPTRI